MREVLFKTVHGSRLYGLVHENSDEDFYTVVTKRNADHRYGRQERARYAKQTIVGDEDTMLVDFGTWVEMCKSGVPQALEAMFSEMAVEDKIAEFREGFRAGTGVVDRYLRTIKSFAYSEVDPFKRKRHALRLALNLNELLKTGRFNPTLSPVQANVISNMAHRDADEVYAIALFLAWQ